MVVRGGYCQIEKPHALCAQTQHLICLEIMLPLASMVVMCLRDLMLEFCLRAHQVVRVEKGSGLTPDHSRTRPADILALDWDRGRHAAFDVTVTSPLSVSPFSPRQACQWGQQHLREAEVQKHRANDPKCSELGWVCVPLAVETL